MDCDSGGLAEFSERIEMMSGRISSLYHCVPDNEDYDAVLDLCYLKNSMQSPYRTMLKNRQTVDELLQLKAGNSSQYEQLISKAKQFSTLRHKLNISDETLYNKPTYKTLVVRILTLIITFPYFIFSIIIDLPILLFTWLLFHFVIEDGAMKNSLRLLLIILLYPFIITILAIFLFTHLPLSLAIMALLLALPANVVVHEYSKNFRLLKSDWKYLKSLELQQLEDSLEYRV